MQIIPNLEQQEPPAAHFDAAARTAGRSNARLERLGPLGRGEETPLRAVVLGMHRSGTSALTSLLDRLGLYAGPDESLMPTDDHNPKGYWEHRELHALDEELLAALGGSWEDVLAIDPRRLGDSARASFLPRARALVGQLDVYGPWVIKDPRLCLLLPLWCELLERPLCVLIHRDPLSVARSLARRDGLPILVGIALWEHYNRAALAASEGLPRVLVGYRELVDDPAASASRLVQALADCGMRGLEELRELSPAVARTLIDSSLNHHATFPGEDLGYLNAQQRDLLNALESGAALLNPVQPLSAGAREALEEHARQAREAAVQRQAVANVQAALAHSVVEREQTLTAALQEIRAATAAARAAGLVERIERIERVEALFAARDTGATALEHRLTCSEQECVELAAELHRTQRAVADREALLAARDTAVAALEHRTARSEQECVDLAAELHRTQRAVAEREALLAAVFASRSWRLGFGLTRLLGVLRGPQASTALERWQSLRDG